MGLHWKPANDPALAALTPPATILVVQPAFFDACTAWPCTEGLYIVADGTIEHEETGEPPEGDAWLWVTEDELLQDAFPTSAAIGVEEIDDEISPDLYARATAFADGGNSAVIRASAVIPSPAVIPAEAGIQSTAKVGDPRTFMARFVHAGGTVQLVEVTGTVIDHGLVLAPLLGRCRTADGESVQPLPTIGMVAYEPTTGTPIAGGHSTNDALMRLDTQVIAHGRGEGFGRWLQRLIDSHGPADIGRQIAAATGAAA